MNSVIKGAGYVLVHTPEMVVYNGTTQTTERVVNPESEYLKELRDHLRSYDTCVNYWPNQVYIGNATPDDLAQVEFPYYDKVKEGAERYGKYDVQILDKIDKGVRVLVFGRYGEEQHLFEPLAFILVLSLIHI